MTIISYFLVLVVAIGLIIILLPYLRTLFRPSKAYKPVMKVGEEFAEEIFPHGTSPTDASSIAYEWKGSLNKKLTTPELPESYGDDQLTLMVKNPRWLYAYWEISPARLKTLQNLFPQEWDLSLPTLRIYQVTPDDGEGRPSHLFDIEISLQAKNWFINVPNENQHYFIELGRKLPGGKFVPILRSAVVKTPRACVSTIIDENWIPCDIYGRLGNLSYGMSSSELQKEPERTER
ncbi:DUF4912 domain-containing protein [Candidatus Formimonas warabiya]|uniref:DUF4912 domain-containing protein n=1 Tax=Formimonas warabiya TaxID=1761012 RepID=A0A3G1KM29_FORW1|nr:DUF4912 domain-containing protein [Candidatus Formimonas warabiya]ATW23490.1 hypothetical protein DCMF_00585 [Candidatus Formimonas warabiya]